MIEVLPELVYVVFLVFCLIDCIQTDALLVRNLPKMAWVLLIIILPLIGGVAWLVAGRPQGAQVGGGGYRGNPVPWRATQTAGFPEYERPMGSRQTGAIDDQLQRDLDRVDREHEEALKRWEADLRAREEKLKKPDGDG